MSGLLGRKSAYGFVEQLLHLYSCSHDSRRASAHGARVLNTIAASLTVSQRTARMLLVFGNTYKGLSLVARS